MFTASSGWLSPLKGVRLIRPLSSELPVKLQKILAMHRKSELLQRLFEGHPIQGSSARALRIERRRVSQAIADGPANQVQVADVFFDPGCGQHEVKSLGETNFVADSTACRQTQVFVVSDGLDDGAPERVRLVARAKEQVLRAGGGGPEYENVHLVADALFAKVAWLETGFLSHTAS